MTGDRRMFEQHGLRPARRAQPCLWTVLGQSCGGAYCVLCVATGRLGALSMWTDVQGSAVATAFFDFGDFVGSIHHIIKIERTVPGITVEVTDWGRGTLILFRRRDIEAVAS